MHESALRRVSSQTIKRRPEAHAVVTTGEAGWAGRKNGELLELAQGKFDVILTVDRRFVKHEGHTQTVAIVILRARTNSLESLLPLVPDLLFTLERIRPGEIAIIGPEVP